MKTTYKIYVYYRAVTVVGKKTNKQKTISKHLHRGSSLIWRHIYNMVSWKYQCVKQRSWSANVCFWRWICFPVCYNVQRYKKKRDKFVFRVLTSSLHYSIVKCLKSWSCIQVFLVFGSGICMIFFLTYQNITVLFFFIDYKTTRDSVLLYILSALCGYCTIIWEVLNFHFDEFGCWLCAVWAWVCLCTSLCVCGFSSEKLEVEIIISLSLWYPFITPRSLLSQ